MSRLINRCANYSILRQWCYNAAKLQRSALSTKSEPNPYPSTEEEAEKEVRKKVLTADLDPVVDDMMKDGMHPKRHPGKRKPKCITLPAHLERAALNVIKRYRKKGFELDVERMYYRVFHHQLPAEQEELITKRHEITEKVLATEKPVDIEALTEDEKAYLLEKRHKKIDRLVKKAVYNWKEIEWDEYAAVVYMAARLPANYAALTSVFNEIKANEPKFQPKTLFDFGSGVGTTMYAANEAWPRSLTEHFNVDLAEPLNEIARLLLQGGNDNHPQLYNNIFFRQFLPVSHTIKYDLVVSAFSLLDLPSYSSRINVIENLWNKTQDMLVVVEHGNRDGFQALLEARNFVLEKSGHDVTKTYYVDKVPPETAVKPMDPNQIPTSHIVAPCSHHLSCPRLYTGGPVLCNFEVPFNPIDFGQKPDIVKERYSYIVLRRGAPPDRDERLHAHWPRIVQPVRQGSKHFICRMCCPDGAIKSVTFTKSKHDGNLYKCAKAAAWGDLMPVAVREIDKPVTRWELWSKAVGYIPAKKRKQQENLIAPQETTKLIG